MNDCEFGGSANGDLLSSLCSIGECTVVASANRGVRGILSEDPEEEEDVRSRDKDSDRIFSLNAEGVVSCLYGQLEGGD